MQNLQFAFDKAAAAVYEGIALQKIQDWYASQGLKVHARYNEANGLEAKRGFDLIDTYGKKWECKCDRMASRTENVFLEHQSLSHSEADFMILFACGLTYILSREDLLALKSGPWRNVSGGDNDSAVGTLVPLSELADFIV